MTAETHPRGYAKGRAKRRQIVEAAFTLFGEVGYRGASLREVAARCGISHPGLLHHFPSKESLLEAVLEHRDAVDLERYPVRAGAGLDRLRSLVALVEHNSQVPGLVELFAGLSTEAASADHPAHDYFVRRYRDARDGLREAFEAVRSEGLLRPGLDPRRLAVATIAQVDGLQVQWLLDRGSVDMAEELRAFLAQALVEPVPGLVPADDA